jgi:hypothetical protein
MNQFPTWPWVPVPLGPFQIVSKIPRDIRSSRYTTGVFDTGDKWKNLQPEKF